MENRREGRDGLGEDLHIESCVALNAQTERRRNREQVVKIILSRNSAPARLRTKQKQEKQNVA